MAEQIFFAALEARERVRIGEMAPVLNVERAILGLYVRYAVLGGLLRSTNALNAPMVMQLSPPGMQPFAG